MDTTPKYIKMCNCSEIQDIIPKKVADDTGRKYIDVTAQVLKYHIGVGKLIWLPRQDQLQEMVDNISEPINVLRGLINWVDDPYGFGTMPFPKQMDKLNKWFNYIISFNSYEQLWLAFVMHEKYGKMWDDEEGWVKIEIH